MALYEFRCRECDDVFEVRRPMAEASAPAPCPQGHADTVRLLSVFAATGRSNGSAASAAASAPTPMMGGGCGGGCACHAARMS